MSCAGLSILPEDILSDIYHRITKKYLERNHGFKRCCKLAEALPCFSSLSLPPAPLKQWTQKGLPWEGIKWALLRQPSASLVHIIVLKEDPGSATDLITQEWQPQPAKYTWEGPVQEEEEDCDEELKALLEVSEDERGFRALVLRVFPRYEDDADNSTVHRISQLLRPLVDKLLQLGIAGLQGLKLNADIIDCPNVLCQLPLRHLELEIGKSSTAHLKEITAALSQCTTLEYLSIKGSKYSDCLKMLPELYLRGAPKLKRVHLQACFPKGSLYMPPGCQLRLDLEHYPYRWSKRWQSENGQELLCCIPAMRLNFQFGGPGLWPSNIQDFKVLQYLELQCPGDFSALARLEGIPNVRLDIYHQESIAHTAGSWQSLEVCSLQGFEIRFADIDAFVRDNPKFFFETTKAIKSWRSMSNALYAASERQGVGCFPYKSANGNYSKKLSNIRDVAEAKWCDKHLVCIEDFWPSQSMQSCLASIPPCPKIIRVPQRAQLDIVNLTNPDPDNVTDPKRPLSLAANPETLPAHNHRRPALKRKFRDHQTWPVQKLKAIRGCTRGVKRVSGTRNGSLT